MSTISRRSFIKTGIAAGSVMLASPKDARPAEVKTLPPDRRGVLVDTTVCIGCRRCEWACKNAHSLPAGDITDYDDESVFANKRRPDDKALTIVNRYEKIGDERFPTNVKIQCMHCEQPACLSACIVGAFKKDDTGAVVWDTDKCIGCRYCMVACPFQIPAFEYEKALDPKIMKCDFCIDRQKNGELPACVEICPAEALTFSKRSELITLAHRKIELFPERYYNKVYGEAEVGGTSWLYLASREFMELGFLKLGTNPAPGVSESIQHGIFAYFVPPIAFYALLGGVMWLNKNRNRGEE